MKTAADWCRRTQLLLGSEKDTGRTLLGTDRTSALLLLMLMLVEDEEEVVMFFLLRLVTVVLLRMEALAVALAAAVGMLLGGSVFFR